VASRRLVLWDLDHTLLRPGRFGGQALRAAFARMFGVELAGDVPYAGRTDRAIVRDFMTLLVPERSDEQPALQDLAAEIAEERRALFGPDAVMAGAASALAAVARVPHAVQSVLTGNLRRLGVVKLTGAGLADALDLEVGAFGDHHLVRAELVDVARGLASRKYGVDFAGRATVVVGDTPLDVEAALARDAVSVAVATGQFSAVELSAAGAHVVLPDLTDPGPLLDVLERAAR
jgi:phosphoglycolate phosphatase-like HAD superfamily hydrolase